MKGDWSQSLAMISRSPRWTLRGVEQIAAAAPGQEFRASAADRVVPSPPRGRLACLVLRQWRQREHVAPHLPGLHDLVEVGTDAERNCQGRVAMCQHQHLGIVAGAQPDTEKIADANADRHLHAVQGPAQNDSLAMKFDLPHAAIGTAVMRVEIDRQRKRVEPQGAARPGGIDPACCCLTPHGLVSPPGLCSRSMACTLPEPRPFRLKKAG